MAQSGSPTIKPWQLAVLGSIVVAPVALAWLVGWQAESWAARDLKAVQSQRKTLDPALMAPTAEDKQLFEAKTAEAYQDDLATSLAAERITLSALRAAKEEVSSGAAGSKRRARDMATSVSNALKSGLALPSSPRSAALETAVAELQALLPEPPKDPPSTATPAPTEPTMWKAVPTGNHGHELLDFVRETEAWIRANPSWSEPTKNNLVYLAQAMAPTLLSFEEYENRPAYSRVAPLLGLQDCEHPIAIIAGELTMQDATWTGPSRGFIDSACEKLDPNAPARLRVATYMLAARTRALFPADEKASKDYYQKMCKALVDYVRQHACAPPSGQSPPVRQLRAATEFVSERLILPPTEMAEKTLEEIRNLPGVDECLVETVTGALEREVAWRHRGGGYASTVRDAAWELFNSKLESAYKHLKRAWTLDSQRAESAALLVAVTMGGGAPSGESPKLWFDRAVQSDPTLRSAYDAYIWSLRPRWGGSRSAMEALGEAALKAGRFDSSIPAVYLRALRDVCDDGAGYTWLTKPEVTAHLEELADGYAKAGDSRWDAEIATLRLVIAFAQHDYEKMAAILREASFTIDFKVMGAAGLTARAVIVDAWALSGPTAPEVAAADELLRSGKTQEAVDAYAAIVAKAVATGVPAPRRDALEDRLATARLALGLTGTELYEVPVDARMHGWRLDMGYWGSPADGTAACGGVGAPMSARLGIAPGQSFEASVEFMVWTRSDLWAQSAIQFCSTTGSNKSFYALAWYPSRDLLELSSTEGWQKIIRIPHRDAPMSEPLVLQVGLQVFAGDVAVAVDGKNVYVGPLPGSSPTNANAFAIGTTISPNAATKTGFRNLKIRRLTQAPAVFTDPRQAKVDP